MKKLAVIILSIMLFAWNDSAMAQKPAIVLDNDAGWQKIGETIASFRTQDESIVVIGADEFSAIKIKVEEAPLQIERLQVFYESGEMEEIDVKKKIEAGQESDVFQLENPDRDIQKVAFTYNTAPNQEGEKADVILYGRKTGEEPTGSDAYRDDREDDMERAEEDMEETGDDIERETEETANEIEREAEETEDDIEREAYKAEENIEREAEETENELDETADNTESDIERAAENTGDAIAETASKAAAEIDDQRHDTKVGPDGQTIYISDDDRHYYINEKGKRVFVSEWQLKDKKDKD